MNSKPNMFQQKLTGLKSEDLTKAKIDVYDVKDKLCIVRVEDPANYGPADFITRLLKQHGAALVLIAKPSDKIECMNDEELASVGLRKL